MRPAELVVRGGTVVEAGWSAPADVFVAGGVVIALAEPGTPAPGTATEIDATGRLVMPGGVDPHCHVGFTSGDFTSLDDYTQCTTAAVFGGTTTIVDFAIPDPASRPPTRRTPNEPRRPWDCATAPCTPASWSGTRRCPVSSARWLRTACPQ